MVSNQGGKKRQKKRVAKSIAAGGPGGTQRHSTKAKQHRLILELALHDDAYEMGSSIADLVDRPWLREAFIDGVEHYVFTPREGFDAHFVWSDSPVEADVTITGTETGALREDELDRLNTFVMAAADVIAQNFDWIDTFADSALSAFRRGDPIVTSFDEQWEEDLEEGEVDDFPDEREYVSVSLPVPPRGEGRRSSYEEAAESRQSTCTNPRCLSEWVIPQGASGAGTLIGHRIEQAEFDYLLGTVPDAVQIESAAPAEWADWLLREADIKATDVRVRESARTENFHALMGLPPRQGSLIPTRVERFGAGMPMPSGVAAPDKMVLIILTDDDTLGHTQPIRHLLSKPKLTSTFDDGWRYDFQPDGALDIHYAWRGGAPTPRVSMKGQDRVAFTSRDRALMTEWLRQTAALIEKYEPLIDPFPEAVIRAARRGNDTVRMDVPEVFEDGDWLFVGDHERDYRFESRVVTVDGIGAVGAEGVQTGRSLVETIRRECFHALLDLPSWREPQQPMAIAAASAPSEPDSSGLTFAPKPPLPPAVLMHIPTVTKPTLTDAIIRLGDQPGIMPSFIDGHGGIEVYGGVDIHAYRDERGEYASTECHPFPGRDASELELTRAFARQALDALEDLAAHRSLLRVRVARAVLDGDAYSVPIDEGERTNGTTYVATMPWLNLAVIPECEGRIEVDVTGLGGFGEQPVTHTWVKPDGTAVRLARQPTRTTGMHQAPCQIEDVQIIDQELPDDVHAALSASIWNVQQAAEAVESVEVEFNERVLQIVVGDEG